MTPEQKMIYTMLRILGNPKQSFRSKACQIHGAFRMANALDAGSIRFPDDDMRDICDTAYHLGYGPHGDLRGEI